MSNYLFVRSGTFVVVLGIFKEYLAAIGIRTAEISWLAFERQIFDHRRWGGFFLLGNMAWIER